jgi:hypothetical protein
MRSASNHPKFPHKHNADGSIDSICAKCFSIVARHAHEGDSDLQKAEMLHRCRGLNLRLIFYPPDRR